MAAKFHRWVWLLALSAVACGEGGSGDGLATAVPDAPDARAKVLTREAILVDTHVDVPYRIHEQGDAPDDISVRTEGGHFDWPRAREGGLDAPFMSIYVPSDLEQGGAFEHAEHLIDMVEGFAVKWPDKFEVARSPADVRRIAAAGRVALPMGMENGAPIEGDLANLKHFHARGIRYITLTHAENNHICDSSYATERTWNGLSPFGAEVVAEMNRLGIMIDVSHVSDAAFDQILERTTAPVIASHSSCRAFTPGFERNLDDARISRLAENGGVIQINFGSAFLTAEANAASTAMWKEVGGWVREHDLDWTAPEAEEYRRAYVEAHPTPSTSVADVADHIDHVVALVGVDHVGIGSDFDGVTEVPDGLSDVAQYPVLVAELLRRGYTDEELRKILGENILRVWEEVERVGSSS